MQPDRRYVEGRAFARLHSGSRMRTVIRGLVAAVDDQERRTTPGRGSTLRWLPCFGQAASGASFTVRGQALRDPDEQIVGSVEVFSAREANPYAGKRQNRRDDSLDSVTGLATRRFGELHLKTLMQAVSELATTLGVLYVDADHFKDVNDTFGHKSGDAVLRMVSQTLVNGLRRGDIPVRWGGEEFLALLPGIDEAGLAATAERVRMLVENSWIQNGETQVRVTVSVGATMAVPTESADDLVDRADGLMYTSKRSGRNRVTTDTGVLISGADRPILGTAIPWEATTS
jgi:diguanylate cyclase (GGDEF)-like protein